MPAVVSALAEHVLTLRYLRERMRALFLSFPLAEEQKNQPGDLR